MWCRKLAVPLHELGPIPASLTQGYEGMKLNACGPGSPDPTLSPMWLCSWLSKAGNGQILQGPFTHVQALIQALCTAWPPSEPRQAVSSPLWPC